MDFDESHGAEVFALFRAPHDVHVGQAARKAATSSDTLVKNIEQREAEASTKQSASAFRVRQTKVTSCVDVHLQPMRARGCARDEMPVPVISKI